MSEVKIVFRGSIPKSISDFIEETAQDLGIQDNVFITDVKTHSVDMIAFDGINALVNRVMGKFGLSIIRTFTLRDGTEGVVLGKLQDSQVTKTMQEQGRGLFK